MVRSIGFGVVVPFPDALLLLVVHSPFLPRGYRVQTLLSLLGLPLSFRLKAYELTVVSAPGRTKEGFPMTFEMEGRLSIEDWEAVVPCSWGLEGR